MSEFIVKVATTMTALQRERDWLERTVVVNVAPVNAKTDALVKRLEKVQDVINRLADRLMRWTERELS